MFDSKTSAAVVRTTPRRYPRDPCPARRSDLRVCETLSPAWTIDGRDFNHAFALTNRAFGLAAPCLLISTAGAAEPGPPERIEVYPKRVRLVGTAARQRLVVVAESGQEGSDQTADVTLTADRPADRAGDRGSRAWEHPAARAGWRG